MTSLIYNVVSSRSAGLSTFSQSEMSYASIWLINILMFIGCAPSSTGGGIRTTTLAIIFMTLVSYMRGFKGTVIFKKTIPNKIVVNSSIIILTSLIMVLLFSFISYPLMINLDPHTSLTISDVLFEMSSAYGTVGLSTGLSAMLNSNSVSSYIIIILLCVIMIVGQLGISTSIFVFRSKESNQIITYPKESIRI
ncbi:TrkH family potassium uptake protein [bacterium]|nr:TrkH family potassium uptake protein [bacterium]